MRKWVGAILPKRGLSGMAIDAEYTMTNPQASSATTTHSRVWSKPSTLAGVLDDWRPRLPPNYLYYAGRRNPPPALRAFIDAMKACLPHTHGMRIPPPPPR